MVIQHWILLTSCWRYPNHSAVKAAQTIRSYALLLASALAGLMGMWAVLEHIDRCFAVGCRMNARKQRPNAYQLLLAAPA